MSKKKFQGNSLNWIGVWHDEKQDTFTSAVIQMKELEGLKGAVRITLRPNVNRKNEKSPAYIAKIEEQYPPKKSNEEMIGKKDKNGAVYLAYYSWSTEEVTETMSIQYDITKEQKYRVVFIQEWERDSGCDQWNDKGFSTFEEAWENYKGPKKHEKMARSIVKELEGENTLF